MSENLMCLEIYVDSPIWGSLSKSFLKALLVIAKKNMKILFPVYKINAKVVSGNTFKTPAEKDGYENGLLAWEEYGKGDEDEFRQWLANFLYLALPEEISKKICRGNCLYAGDGLPKPNFQK